MSAPPNTPHGLTICEPLITKVGRMYFKRVGTCRPQRCGARCCTLYACPSFYRTDYEAARRGTRRVRLRDGFYYFVETCAQLAGGRCSVHRTRPVTCYQFPTSPADGVYRLVRRVCSYRFMRITKREYDRIARRYPT